jgi:hypothetical protein
MGIIEIFWFLGAGLALISLCYFLDRYNDCQRLQARLRRIKEEG